MEAEALVRPVVEGAGLELVDVTYRGPSGRRVLRVTVDREGGVDLDTIATVSDKLVRRLDLEGFGEGRYQLEVSSPGLERPLKNPAHFARCVGARIEVRTTEAAGDMRTYIGTLTGVDDDGIDVDVDGSTRRVVFADVASARTVVDWAAELKGAAR